VTELNFSLDLDSAETYFSFSLYVFHFYRSSLHTMMVDTFEWSLKACSGKRPSKRYEHACVADKDSNIIVFGGSSEQGNLNDVWRLKRGIEDKRRITRG
jgi:hypothetical protein